MNVVILLAVHQRCLSSPDFNPVVSCVLEENLESHVSLLLVFFTEFQKSLRNLVLAFFLSSSLSKGFCHSQIFCVILLIKKK